MEETDALQFASHKLTASFQMTDFDFCGMILLGEKVVLGL